MRMDSEGLEKNDTGSENESPAYEKVSGSTNDSQTPEEQGHRGKCFKLSLTVEPLVFAVFFADVLADSVTANFILWRTCENHFHFNKSTCDELAASSENKSDIEALVQPYSATVLTGMNFLSVCLPAITSLFFGPWSDYNGRKLGLIFPGVGFCFKYALLGIFSFFPKLGPEYGLVAVIPVALGGGFVNFISAAYSYVSDITQEDKRFFRITMVELSLALGVYSGLIILSNFFKSDMAYQYIVIYGVSAATVIVVTIPTYFFLPESVENLESGKGLKSIFDLKLFKEMLEICFRKREGGKRAIIFLSIASLTITLSAGSGNTNVLYLFTRLRFGWNIRDFTFWASVSFATYILGSFFGVLLLSKWLKISEPILGMLSYTSQFLMAFFVAFIPSDAPNLMYYAGLVNIFGGLSGPISRAMLSKSVPKDDVGKVFALTSSSESFFPLIIAPMYTVLYNSTIHTLPSAFLLLSGAFYILCWIFYAIIGYIQKKHTQTEFNTMESTSESG